MIQRLILAAALSSSTLAQSVYVVDESGGAGVDFAEIFEAVAVAGPLDRIEVRPGAYLGFLVANPVTIMGQPGVQVAGIDVTGLPAGGAATLVDLTSDYHVSACAGPVIIEHSALVGESVRKVLVADSSDVWLKGVELLHSGQTPPIRIANSSVNLDRIKITAGWSQVQDVPGPHGVKIDAGARVVISDSTVIGGTGGCNSSPLGHTMPGGNALIVEGGSRVVVARCGLGGGIAGFFCSQMSGGGGYALEVLDQSEVYTTNEFSFWVRRVDGSSTLVPNVDMPRLNQVNDAVGGTQFQLQLHAEPGTVGRNFLGRFTADAPFPGALIPRRHNFSFGSSLGAMPPSGTARSTILIPQGRRGTVFFAQGARTNASGQSELSNPIAIVVR